jgi:hypothetical protein
MDRVKRLPPIAYVLFIPIFPFMLLYGILAWLFGFWWCDRCGNRYWITDDVHVYGADYDLMSYGIEKHCNSCKTKKEAD